MKKAWISLLLAVVLLVPNLVVFADQAIEITEQPTDIVAAVGETGSATVTAESEGEISYQWYYKPAKGSTWSVSGMKGAKTATIRVPVTTARLGQQYRCVLTDEQGETIETNVVEVVNANRSEITIVTPPGDIVAKLGTYGTATVVAESEAELSYRWYFKAVGSDTWKASGFEGHDTATITVPVTKARLGQQYKCVITTADGGKAETEPVEVCEPAPSAITIVTAPEDIVAKLGSNGTATVEAESEAELSYRWYFKAVGSDTWKASGFEGAKTATITVPVAKSRLGQQYKCVITTADGGRVETKPVEVREFVPVQSEITIVAQPQDMLANVGEKGTATVAATADTGAELHYQWYFRPASGGQWRVSSMTGAKTATITVPVIKARLGQQYRCVITTADGGRAESNVVTIRERPALTLEITHNPDSYIVIEGQPIQLDVSYRVETGDAEGLQAAYQWYRDGEIVEGATESELVILAVEPEDAGKYCCVVSLGQATATSRIGSVDVIELEEPEEENNAEPPLEPEESHDPTALDAMDALEELVEPEQVVGESATE